MSILAEASQIYKILYSWLNPEEEIKTLYQLKIHNIQEALGSTWLFIQQHELKQSRAPLLRL